MHDHDEMVGEPHPTFERPTLLSSCAMAATEAEARFRVPYPNSMTRDSRVIALDPGANVLMAEISGDHWRAAHFLALADRQPDVSPNDVRLTGQDGQNRLYTAELADADVVVMIASTSEGMREAGIIGRLAHESGVMTAGIVVAGTMTDAVAAAMRPSAAVLVIAHDADYLRAMLSALRA